MARKSGILKNWPKFLLQWGVIAAIAAWLLGFIPYEVTLKPEAYTHPSDMTPLQIVISLTAVLAVVFFSKLFCGYICPLGTVQDLLIRLRNGLRIKSIKIGNGSVADKALRIVKYGLLFLLFQMTAEVNEFFWTIAIASACIILLGSFIVDTFWCRYICPLGAIANSLKFWVWMSVLAGVWYAAGILGLELPWTVLLGSFCLLGYLLEIFHARPSMQILHVTKDEIPCNNCGQCVGKCPYHIELRDFRNGKVNHVDCTLCGECVAACNRGALNIGLSKPTKHKIWNFLPAVITILLIAFGIWAGRNMITPTETETFCGQSVTTISDQLVTVEENI